MSETKNINVTVNDLKDKNYDFFEQIILSLIAKYKNNPNLKNWYAAIGDNCNGSLKENFISIGMIDNNDKINYSRIRIPKNELGKKIIEKFIRSYLHEGIKEQKTVKNYGESLNTVCYIETNDEKFFEVYTIKNDLKIDGFNIDLEYLPQTNIEDTRKIELASISDKIKHLNDMLNEDDEIINKKTL